MNNSISHCLAVILGILITTKIYAATEISPGVLYQGGDKLKVSEYGIEIKVPIGWQAILPQGSEVLVMEPANGSARFIISAVPNTSESAVKQQMMQVVPLDMQNQLQPVALPIKESHLLLQQYRVIGFNPQNLSARGYARIGNNNTAFLLVALEANNRSNYEKLAKEFVNSAVFNKTNQSNTTSSNQSESSDWYQYLHGKTLQYRKTKNGMSVKKIYELCSDNTFSYYTSDSHFNSTGSGFVNNSNTGMWRVQGEQIIFQWRNGSVSRHLLEWKQIKNRNSWGAYVDGVRWFVTPSDVCT